MKVLTSCLLIYVLLTSLGDVTVHADNDDADSSEAQDVDLPDDDEYESDYDHDNDGDTDGHGADTGNDKDRKQEEEEKKQGHIDLPFGCHRRQNGQEILCHKSNFTVLPNRGQFSVKLIHLSIAHSISPIEVLDNVNIESLHTLHLTTVGLRYIRDYAFSSMGSLHTLTLANNSIASVSSRTFLGLKALEVLVLEGNPLHVIPAGTFTATNLPHLWELKLDRCHLYSVKKGWVQGLTRLNVLYLNGNHLSTVPDLSDTTCGLTNLTQLYLNRNNIVEVNNQLMMIPSTLSKLWIQNNLISSVQLNLTFDLHLSLQEIHLGHNRISLFETKGLETLQLLKVLDLQYNHLSSIKPESLPLDKLNLNRVLISGNPWNCSDCANAVLFNDVAVARFNDTDTRCSGPGSYFNLSVYDPSVLRACPQSTTLSIYTPQSRVGVAVVIILLFVVIVVLAFIAVVRRKKRHNHERERLTWQSTRCGRGSTISPPTVSYKQMQNISRYSITEDD